MPTETESVLKQAGEVLTRKIRTEGGKASIRHELMTLEEELLKSDPDSDSRIMAALAEIAFRCNRLDLAIERWKKVQETDSDQRHRARLGIAEALFRKGEAAEALHHLNAAAQPPKVSKVRSFFLRLVSAKTSVQSMKPSGRARSLRKKIEKRLAAQRAIDEYAAAVAALQNGDGRRWRAHVESALRERGYSQSDLDALSPLVRALHDYLFAVELESGPESPELRSVPGNTIFCAGFGWSGSGAVFDYLRQLEDVTVFSRKEVALFQRAGLFPDTVKSLDLADDDQTRRTIMNYISAAFLGFSDSGISATEAQKLESRSLLSACGNPNEISTLARCGERFLNELSATMHPGASGIEDALSRLWDGLLAWRSRDGKAILFNNAIHAYHLGTLLPRFGTPVTAFAVYRDPRDVYVDRIRAHKAQPVDHFIKAIGKKYRVCDSACADESIPHRVIPVQFEDFVSNESDRVHIAMIAGLNPGMLTGSSRTFFPAVSARNIGIYRDYARQDEITKIECELGKYLWRGSC